MSSSSRILAAVSALALAAATAAPLAGAADNPAPKLLKGSPILFVDNQINPGVIAVAFRTDRPLDRKSNGKSIEGRAGVKGHSDSLSTFVKDSGPPTSPTCPASPSAAAASTSRSATATR